MLRKNVKKHQWAEFYLPEYGWILVDPTTSNKQYKDNWFAKETNSGEHIFESYSINGINTTNSFYKDKIRIFCNEILLTKLWDEADFKITPYNSYQNYQYK